MTGFIKMDRRGRHVRRRIQRSDDSESSGADSGLEQSSSHRTVVLEQSSFSPRTLEELNGLPDATLTSRQREQEPLEVQTIFNPFHPLPPIPSDHPVPHLINPNLSSSLLVSTSKIKLPPICFPVEQSPQKEEVRRKRHKIKVHAKKRKESIEAWEAARAHKIEEHESRLMAAEKNREHIRNQLKRKLQLQDEKRKRAREVIRLYPAKGSKRPFLMSKTFLIAYLSSKFLPNIFYLSMLQLH